MKIAVNMIVKVYKNFQEIFSRHDDAKNLCKSMYTQT